MNTPTKSWETRKGRTMAVLCIAVFLVGARVSAAAEDIQHFKMLSTVEYTGKGQFENKAQTQFEVKKQQLSDDRVQYTVTTNDFSLTAEPDVMSFVVDQKTKRISTLSDDLSLLQNVNNRCISSMKHVTRKNIGKTWKQSLDLSPFHHSLPNELKFTLTAMKLSTKKYGDMIAVRALSEPFQVNVLRVGEGMKKVKSKVGAAYLFDWNMEDIYVSIFVFEAQAKIDAPNEKLRHEIATYKTNASGVPVDLTGLGKEFENFVSKVGLSGKGIKVTEKSPLPRWSRSEGLRAAQVTNICAALACEGAPNPVAMICLPAARTVALQSAGKVATAAQMGTISSMLAKTIPGMTGMKISIAPGFMGMGLGTAGAIAGGTAGTVAIAGGLDSGGSSHRSPSSP